MVDIWVDVTPLDEGLDMGGYASFNRSYPQTSVVTVTAPLTPLNYPDWHLVAVWVDGVSYAAGNGTVTVTIAGQQNIVALQYRDSSFNPNAARSGNNSGGSIGR